MSGTCADCVFHKVSEYGGLICRRFPPVPIETSPASSRWPAVDLDDTCGEHKAIYVPFSEHPDA